MHRDKTFARDFILCQGVIELSTREREIRTPDKQLLIGCLEVKKGKPVLCVQSRGRQDVIEVAELLDLIKSYLE